MKQKPESPSAGAKPCGLVNATQWAGCGDCPACREFNRAALARIRAEPRTKRELKAALARGLREAGCTEATVRRELPGLYKEALHDWLPEDREA